MISNQVDYIDEFTFPMLLLAIVGNQYYVYGGIYYNKKIQVFFINSFSTKDRNSFHSLSDNEIFVKHKIEPTEMA